MSFNLDTAKERAKIDLAKRIKVSAADIKEVSSSEREFPNSALGAPVSGEMSLQMISDGWEIILQAGGKNYDYRADKYQVRLYKFNGKNYVVESI